MLDFVVLLFKLVIIIGEVIAVMFTLVDDYQSGYDSWYFLIKAILLLVGVMATIEMFGLIPF